MTRRLPKTYNLTRKKKKVGVLNPGSKPGKWDDSMIFRAMFLAGLGLTENQISVALNIHVESIHYWKTTKPEFEEALLQGKTQYTERVQNSLVESATGYSHPAIHFSVIGDKVVQTPYIKHYRPSDTAMIFYLKNRAPDRWMDVHRIEGAVQHRHTLDLTKLSSEELKVLKTIGLVELPEHGNITD